MYSLVPQIFNVAQRERKEPGKCITCVMTMLTMCEERENITGFNLSEKKRKREREREREHNRLSTCQRRIKQEREREHNRLSTCRRRSGREREILRQQ